MNKPTTLEMTAHAVKVCAIIGVVLAGAYAICKVLMQIGGAL